MADALSVTMFALAAAGLAAAVVQTLALRAHLRGADRAARTAVSASILKPLCGVDDDLEENLASFAALDHPRYEVLLGVRSRKDPAHAVARAAAARWPGRFRVVIQRGEPGANPKVNQLVTLAAEARGALLVVSDSNVRVHAAYLCEIAGLLEDPAVGLVTHPIAGVGEERLGSLFDNLHLAGAIATGVVAAQRLAGRDVVVGKSMAFRAADLAALGGFLAVKDVLAEDYVLGRLVGSRLGKQVAIARRPVQNVSQRRGLSHFLSRYARWAVLQRQAVGPAVYAAQALLNPVLLAGCAFAAAPGAESLAALAGTCGAKAALDGVAARGLRPGGFTLRQLAAVPAKDLLFGLAWLYGLVRSDVRWRGNRLRVLPGTRIAPPVSALAPGAVETAAHS